MLHDVIQVDEPAAAAVEDGDTPPPVGVGPKILDLLKCLHDFASRSSLLAQLAGPCCGLNPQNGAVFPLRRPEAQSARAGLAGGAFWLRTRATPTHPSNYRATAGGAAACPTRSGKVEARCNSAGASAPARRAVPDHAVSKVLGRCRFCWQG